MRSVRGDRSWSTLWGVATRRADNNLLLAGTQLQVFTLFDQIDGHPDAVFIGGRTLVFFAFTSCQALQNEVFWGHALTFRLHALKGV